MNTRSDVVELIPRVLQNCDISDARHAGFFSVCGLALRLRDLFKWEKGLPPWEEGDSAEVLAWIGNKEKRWGELEDLDFQRFTIQGNTCDPFDIGRINALLQPAGIFYGAGYAHHLKPTFFLAEIKETLEIDGIRVYVLGRELARDLLTLPAMSQGEGILLREDSARRFLWDSLFYLKKSSRPAADFALERCGLKIGSLQGSQFAMEKILAEMREVFLYHELGEIRDRVFPDGLWREIMAAFPHSPIELLARAVKDLLADTGAHGTLRRIIEMRREASLGFLTAFFDGLRENLFPELRPAFFEFTRSRRWKLMERAVSAGNRTARRYAETMAKIFRKGMEKGDLKWVENTIKRCLIDPLT
jgi:hypothetical protein